MRKYFSLHPVLTRNAWMSIVVGHRSAGKTYSFKDWAIRDWLKTGKEWVYCRRYKDELSTKDTFFDDIAYKYDLEVTVRGWRAYARKIGEKEWKPFGYFMALSQQQRYKGTNLPKVNKLCLDEFIIENTRNKYLPDEVNQLISLCVTIDRDRNELKVLLFSNAGLLNNPYFLEYDIKASDLIQSTWIKRNNGSVIFYYYNPDEDTRNTLITSHMAMIAPQKYNDYAYDNMFFDAGNEFIVPKKPKGYVSFMCITDGTNVLRLYKSDNNYNTSDCTIWVKIEKNEPDKFMLSCNPSKPIENAKYNPQYLNTLRKNTHNLLVTYDSPETRIRWYDMIKP